MNSLKIDVENLKDRFLYRSLKDQDSEGARDVIDFTSNDTWQLSKNILIKKQLIDYLNNNKSLISSTGSRLLSGNISDITTAENILAQVADQEEAILFTSTYMANMAVISSFKGEQVEFFSDESNHASIIDGIKLCKSNYNIFKHNDMNDLKVKISNSHLSKKVIIVESLYSMSGDSPPFCELIELSKNYKALLIIDESHATGIWGNNMLGLSYDYPFNPQTTVRIHSAGKALSASGGFVICPNWMKERIINLARHFIFTTAISPIIAYQITCTLNYILKNKLKLQADLNKIIDHFNKNNPSNPLIKFNLKNDQKTNYKHIIPIIIGPSEACLELEHRLLKVNLKVSSIRYPTVKENSSTIRLSLNVSHSPEHCNTLARFLYGQSI